MGDDVWDCGYLGKLGWWDVVSDILCLIQNPETDDSNRGQSDWTRYANRPFAPIIAQTVMAPVAIFICGTIGIIVTSCGNEILGATYWEPFVLLSKIQGHYNNSARARAGVFFAGAG